MIKRMRVEPISTNLERYRKGGVVHPVTIAKGLVYLLGLPPFDPESGEIK
jgi:2-iminobutanoate/2-iminopropanoate deaminase